MIRRRLVIHGCVQGVGFRLSCEERARSRRLAGWVRNLGDGSVEVVLEGERDAVQSMIEWCRVGPRLALVTSVDVGEEAPEGLTSFAVR